MRSKAMNKQIEKEQDNECLSNKTISVQIIPKQVWKPQTIFKLKGLPFIDLNPNDESKLSNLNHFSQVCSSIILREQGIFYKNITPTQIFQYDSIQKVIILLKKMNNLDALQLAESLKWYEEFQKNNENIKKQIKFITMCSSQVRAQVAQKRQEFDKLREEKVLNLSKEKYILFVDLTYDYTDFSQILIGEGMNEAFINFLGCDLESMQSITMRKGNLSFIDKDSHFKIINLIVQQGNRNPEEEHLPKKITVSLTTLDDIKIDVEVILYTLFCSSAAAFKGYFHPQFFSYIYDRKTVICDFDIQDFHIRKINAIRSRNLNEGLNALDNKFNVALSNDDKSHNIDSRRIESNSTGSKQSYKILTIPSKITAISQNENQNNIIDSLIYDIPYAVQSQDFLEKFYDLEQLPKGNGSYIEHQSDRHNNNKSNKL